MPPNPQPPGLKPPAPGMKVEGSGADTDHLGSGRTCHPLAAASAHLPSSPTGKAEIAVALPPGVSVSTELASAHQAPHQALRPAPGHPKSQHVLTARATTVYILWGSGRGLEGEVCPKASTPSPDTGLPSQPLPGHRKGTLRTQCQPKNKRPRWEATSLYPPSKQNCSSGKH